MTVAASGARGSGEAGVAEGEGTVTAVVVEKDMERMVRVEGVVRLRMAVGCLL